ALYKATHASASRFASYNFHNYFVRRTDETFRPVIQSLESDPKSMTPEAVTRFLEERGQELEVLKRSAEVNRLYEGPKLVVEHATPITGGGGAGAEAAAGGGGQPI
ncbi:putative mitochondrion protein, partial [Dioszegia hungarica]